MEDHADTQTVFRHCHLLRLACDAPTSSAFFAALHWWINYTIDNMLDYHGPAPTPPQSVAHVATSDRNPDAPMARDQVQNARDELMTLCVLASYLMGDGNPKNNPPPSQYPRQIVLEPVALDTPGPLNPRPPEPPLSTVGRISALDAEHMRVLRMDARCKLILATTNRCFHGARQHGCVLTALFLSLASRVPELTALVRDQMQREGLTDAEQALVIQYLTSELHTLCLYPMSYDNASTLWTTWWHTATHVLRTNLFADMETAIKTREEENFENIRKVHEQTQKKRDQRARAQMRRRKARMRQEEDVEEIIGLSDDDDDETESGGAGVSAGNSDDELSGIAKKLSSCRLIRSNAEGDSDSEVDRLSRRMGELTGAAETDDDDDDDDDLSDLLQTQ